MNNNPLVPFVQAGYAVLAVETQEELRLTKMVSRMTYVDDDGKTVKYTVLIIDSMQKLREIVDDETQVCYLCRERKDKTKDKASCKCGSSYPAAFAEAHNKPRTILLVHEFQYQVKQPVPQRLIKDSIPELKANGSVAILVAPSWQLPQELEKDVHIVRLPLATDEEMSHALDVVADAVGVEVPEESRVAILRAASGLTLQQAEDAMARSVLATGGTFDPTVISGIKMETIKQSGVLTPEKPNPIGAVDGMESLIDHLVNEVKNSFGTKLSVRREFFFGPPGTGKSETVKMIASILQVPLIAMNFSDMQSKWVGDSQANLNKALDIVTAFGPCVLWCDEAGDQMRGAHGAAAENGNPIVEMIGKFAKWTEESQPRHCLIIFTANELTMPEKILSRMDEIWFIDLPNDRERLPIARCIMKRYDIPEELIEPAAKRLADLSAGWSGREMRKAIEAAARRTNRMITPEAIELAASRIKPQSITNAEYINGIREIGLAHHRVANTPSDSHVEAAKQAKSKRTISKA